ncbi:MAG: polyisoprenoid-binding protein [Magnetococcales bacterium]|nr:polyisoprenoid-binding protein [Magnetococcales bacterium]MEC8066383.1 YceI family protein [Pseudomonadota bacterium]|tara:strand:+ start:3569 stop:4183 length:615 start_codon:yes stop_codon:yes gene_type:complete
MKRTTLALCTALFISQGALAEESFKQVPAGIYTLDPTHASITWQVNHLGLSNYTARFTKFTAEVDYNPKNPEESVITASIDPTSIKTDYPYPQKKDFDKKLVENEDWFNASAFPKIDFKSTKLEMTGEKTAIMTGDLTLLGQTKPVTLNVNFNGAYEAHPFTGKPALGFSAKGTLNRSDWGFTTYVPNIGDEVKLIIETEFEKK